jgi:hypothetical protein
MLKRALLAVTLVACTKTTTSSKPTMPDDPPPAATTAPSCDEVRSHAYDHFKAASADLGKIEQAVDVLVTSCNDDAWSADARTCVVEASADDMESCRTHLDPEVAKKIDARMEAIFNEGNEGDEGDDDDM